MWKLLCLTLLVCAVSGGPSVRRQAGYLSLPASSLQVIRQSSLPVLQDSIKVAGQSLVSAAEQVNTTKADCVVIVENSIKTQCKSCVESRCKAKADSCAPNLWEGIAMMVEDFFTNKIPGLFNSALDAVLDVPDAIVDALDLNNWDNFLVGIGTDVLDTVLDVGNVFVNIGNEVGDAVGSLGTSIWDGVQDVGNFLGDAALDVGNFLVDGLGDIGDIAVDIGDSISGAIGDLGNLIGGLFGKKKRDVVLAYYAKRHARRQVRREARSQVRSEPSCSQLQSEGGDACMGFMSSCGNICDSTWLQQQYCTTFNTAVTAYQAALQSHFWVTTIPAQNQDFVIDQVMVDGSSYDFTTGGYNRADVTVTMFGETYSFPLDSSISPFDLTPVGPEIAQKALDQYKASHLPPSTKVYAY
ncbi:uncharacterized protein [Branchiostoma lanceolatum]|uniref:uncharacterized protein n=1 Tax=Branchiostoma lanceolatum TaxID=7740 RepID=UPI0034533E43